MSSASAASAFHLRPRFSHAQQTRCQVFLVPTMYRRIGLCSLCGLAALAGLPLSRAKTLARGRCPQCAHPGQLVHQTFHILRDVTVPESPS